MLLVTYIDHLRAAKSLTRGGFFQFQHKLIYIDNLLLTMNSKFIVAIVVLSFVIVSGSAIAGSGNAMPDNHSQIVFNSGTTFNGNVTVFANGTVSPSQADVTHNGDVFDLNSNINGTVRFFASNSILNGNGHSITDSMINSTLLTLANNSGSTIENLRINSSSNGTVGVQVFNTSRDSVSNITVSSSLFGFDVAQYVQNLNVSNSNFTLNSRNDNSSVVVTGVNASNLFSSGPPKGLPGTGNITYYSDNMVSLGVSPVFISLENYVSVKDSNLTSKSNKSTLNTVILDNYTVFRGDNFLINEQDFGIVFGFFFNPHPYATYGNVFADNSIKINSSVTVGLLSFDSSLFINGNSFMGTHYGVSPADVIFNEGNNTTISGNTFSKLDTGYYFQLGGNNISITGNTINLTSSRSAYGISGLLTNSTISGNDIFETSNSSSTQGISLSGNNINVLSNHLALNGSTDTAGISVYDGAHSSYSNYNNISDNIISITNSSGTGILLGSGTQGVNYTTVSGNTVNVGGKDPNGIFYLGSNDTITENTININSSSSSTGIGSVNVYVTSSYDHITNNNIHSFLYSSGAQFGFYFGYGLSYSVISGNQFISKSSFGAGIQSYVMSNHDSIYSNTFTFPSGSNHNSGLSLNDFFNSTLSNNSFYNTNITLDWNTANHVVVNGNYFYNQYTAMSLINSDNLTFYQNDFVNFTHTLSLSGKNTNISFNVSYPVGGNYWSNYTGSDKYSGPDQNAPGSDGVGDTPYNVGYGLMDKYPLMKPWSRPAVTFTESGLSTGSSWSVLYNGKLYSSDQNSITFALHDSTYQVYKYGLQNVSGYYLNTSSAVNFSYSGTGTTYNIVYYHYAYLAGTVTPGQVTIKIGNSSYNITDGKFNFTLKAGSYTVEFVHSGYVTKTYQLTITAGEDKNLTVSLARPFSDLVYYVIGGIAAAVVVGVSATVIFRRK